MKKLISIFLSTSLSLMFFNTPVLAENAIRESSPNEQLTIYLNLDSMIKDKVFLQKDGINKVKELSAKASDKYRVLLLDNYEKNVIVYPVISFFVPSLGNWINDLKINFYKNQDNTTFTVNFVSVKY